MTYFPFAAFLMLLMLVVPYGSATAQNNVINLNEAIRRTLSESPSLKARGYALQSQEARVQQQGIRPRPQLSVQVQDIVGTGDFQALESAEATLSISWLLERGVRESRVNAARAQTDVIEAETRIQRLDAAAETARRYIEALLLQTRMEIARQAVRLGQDAVMAISERVEAGTTPSAELARARADLARRELAVEDIEHELLGARYRLAAQWGATEPGFTRLLGDILQVPEPAPLDELRHGLDNNPDLSAYLNRQRMEEARLALARARNRQPWEVSAGIRRIEASNDTALVAGFSMPLGPENTNRGNVEAARAEIARTEQEARAERVQLETELFVIHQEMRHGIQLSRVLSEEVLPLYEQALEETREAYQRGRYSYLEWNAAQRDLLAARYDLVDAGALIYNNLIEIERLTGLSAESPLVSP